MMLLTGVDTNRPLVDPAIRHMLVSESQPEMFQTKLAVDLLTGVDTNKPLVDSASDHTLVSQSKPCLFRTKLLMNLLTFCF